VVDKAYFLAELTFSALPAASVVAALFVRALRLAAGEEITDEAFAAFSAVAAAAVAAAFLFFTRGSTADVLEAYCGFVGAFSATLATTVVPAILDGAVSAARVVHTLGVVSAYAARKAAIGSVGPALPVGLADGHARAVAGATGISLVPVAVAIPAVRRTISFAVAKHQFGLAADSVETLAAVHSAGLRRFPRFADTVTACRSAILRAVLRDIVEKTAPAIAAVGAVDRTDVYRLPGVADAVSAGADAVDVTA